MAKHIKQSVQTDPAPDPQTAINSDIRQQEFAQSAYYLAPARGFSPGAELADWLEAEHEIASGSADE